MSNMPLSNECHINPRSWDTVEACDDGGVEDDDDAVGAGISSVVVMLGGGGSGAEDTVEAGFVEVEEEALVVMVMCRVW